VNRVLKLCRILGCDVRDSNAGVRAVRGAHRAPAANLPARLSEAKLAGYAIENERDHILESNTRVLITLGEGPRS